MFIMEERLEKDRYKLIEETKKKAPAKVKNALIQQLRIMNIAKIYARHADNGYDSDYMQSEIKKYLKNTTKALASLDPYEADELLDDIIYEVLPL